MPLILHLAALLLSPPLSAGEILIKEPAIPTRLETALTAECEGRRVAVRYTVSRPGPDLFSHISVDGIGLSPQELGRLNDMISGHGLASVDIPSCDGEGDAFETHLRIAFGYTEQRRHYLLGIRSGTFRIIR